MIWADGAEHVLPRLPVVDRDIDFVDGIALVVGLDVGGEVEIGLIDPGEIDGGADQFLVDDTDLTVLRVRTGIIGIRDHEEALGGIWVGATCGIRDGPIRLVFDAIGVGCGGIVVDLPAGGDDFRVGGIVEVFFEVSVCGDHHVIDGPPPLIATALEAEAKLDICLTGGLGHGQDDVVKNDFVVHHRDQVAVVAEQGLPGCSVEGDIDIADRGIAVVPFQLGEGVEVDCADLAAVNGRGDQGFVFGLVGIAIGIENREGCDQAVDGFRAGCVACGAAARIERGPWVGVGDGLHRPGVWDTDGKRLFSQ